MIDQQDFSYKELIETFCSEKDYTEKQRRYLLKPCIYEKPLFELMPFQLGSLVIEDMCGTSNKDKHIKGKSSSYLKSSYSYIVQFFDWCVRSGLIPLNPYREIDSLAYDNLLYQMTEAADITILYQEDLAAFVQAMDYNRELYAVILGLLFDGVSSNKELASLRHKDISGNILRVSGRRIPLSGFSLDALGQYRKVSVLYLKKANGVESQEYLQHQDYLLKKPAKNYNPDIADEKYIKSNANAVGNYLKKLNLNYIDIIRSGLLYALRAEFQTMTDEEFCHIFLTAKKLNTGIARKINKVMAVYGGTSVSVVTDNVFPYVIKSKYYR